MEIEKVYYKDVNNYLLVKKGDKDISKRVKVKGEAFVPQGGILKGFDKPIIAIAIQNYLLYNTPIEKTIKEHTDIYDFCTAIKIDDSYENYVQYVKKEILYNSPTTKKPYKNPKSKIEILEVKKEQRSVRFYVSNYVEKDGLLYGHHIIKERTIVVDEQYIQGKLDKIILQNLTDEKLQKKKESLPKIGDIIVEQVSHCANQCTTLFNNYVEKPFIEYNINYDYYIKEAQSIVENIKPFDYNILKSIT